MGQGRVQGEGSQQEGEFGPQSPDFATLGDGEQNTAHPAREPVPRGRHRPRLSQRVSCSLQPRQIRVSSRLWRHVPYQAFGASLPPSPAPLLLSLLLSPTWCHFPHLSCVSLLSSLLHPLLHLHLGSLIPQFPSQLFRLRTSPHCDQILYTKSNPQLSFNPFIPPLHTPPCGSIPAWSIPPASTLGARRALGDSPQAVPSIPAGWAGRGKAWSLKVPPITLRSGAHNAQGLCWALAESLGKGSAGPPVSLLCTCELRLFRLIVSPTLGF